MLAERRALGAACSQSRWFPEQRASGAAGSWVACLRRSVLAEPRVRGAVRSRSSGWRNSVSRGAESSRSSVFADPRARRAVGSRSSWLAEQLAREAACSRSSWIAELRVRGAVDEWRFVLTWQWALRLQIAELRAHGATSLRRCYVAEQRGRGASGSRSGWFAAQCDRGAACSRSSWFAGERACAAVYSLGSWLTKPRFAGVVRPQIFSRSCAAAERFFAEQLTTRTSLFVQQRVRGAACSFSSALAEQRARGAACSHRGLPAQTATCPSRSARGTRDGRSSSTLRAPGAQSRAAPGSVRELLFRCPVAVLGTGSRGVSPRRLSPP